MDIVFGQLHLLMLGTELEAVPADTVSFELCICSYLRASCVHSDRVCRLYSFIINVLLLFECRWSHSLQILLHVRNTNYDSQFLYHQYNTLLGISTFSVTQPVTSQH